MLFVGPRFSWKRLCLMLYAYAKGSSSPGAARRGAELTVGLGEMTELEELVPMFKVSYTLT